MARARAMLLRLVMLGTLCLRGGQSLLRAPGAARSAVAGGGRSLRALHCTDGKDLDALNVDERKQSTRRVRQHVNPLSARYSQPSERPEGWVEQAFAAPEKGFHVDIGCARGRFCLKFAARNEDLNVLGLEIRQPLVVAANAERREVDLENCFFLFCNANVDLRNILREVQAHGPVKSVSIQFPDPHFKKRHHKRRVVQPELVATVAEELSPGGFVFLQGDIHEVVLEMRERFREAELLEDQGAGLEDWLAENPMGVPTEREIMNTEDGNPIYRCIFRKRA